MVIKAKFRVIVFIIENSPFQESILSGLFSALENKGCFIEITTHSANGVFNSKITLETMQNLSIEDFDLVFTIGQNQADLITKAFKDRKYPIPVVFTGISEEKGNELVRKFPFMTGVSVEIFHSHTPLQIIFRLCPQAKTYLIPYREQARFGRMSHDMKSIIDYLEKRKIAALPFPLDQEEWDKAFEEQVKTADIVVVPDNALSSRDVKQIEAVCNQLNKPLFSDGQAARKSGGIYAQKKDFEFMGIKSGYFVNSILIDQQQPSNLPPYVVKNRCKINLNSQDMADSGFFIADDIIASLEGVLAMNKDLPTRSIALCMHSETAFTHGMYFALSQRLQKEPNVNYLIQRYVGWPHDDNLNGQHIERIMSFNYDHIVFLDDNQAYKTWSHAQKHNLAMPPTCTILSIADQLGPAGWRDKAQASGLLIDEVALAAPNPLIPLHLLLDSVKNIKNITLACNASPDKMPPFLANRVATVEQECAKHGIKLTVIGDTNGGMMDEVIEEGITNTVDAYFFYQDAIDGRMIPFISNRLQDASIPFCAGGAMFGQIAPLCYGKNLLKLREYLFDAIHQRHENKEKPKMSVNISQQELYNICVNHPLSVEMGMEISPMLSCFTTHQCVDTMYERNIAACVNAKKRIKRPPETAEQKAAREAKDAAALEKMKKPTTEW